MTQYEITSRFALADKSGDLFDIFGTANSNRAYVVIGGMHGTVGLWEISVQFHGGSTLHCPIAPLLLVLPQKPNMLPDLSASDYYCNVSVDFATAHNHTES